MKFIPPLFLITLFLISCTDDIDLKLNNNPNTLVVNAFLRADDSTYQTIILSRTSSFSDTSSINYEQHANIKIISENNDTATFLELKKGHYTTFFKFKSNTNYRLYIKTTDGHTTSSTFQKAPSVPKIDSIASIDYIYLQKNGILYDKLIDATTPIYVPCISFKDEKNVFNYYTMNVYELSDLQSTIKDQRLFSNTEIKDGSVVPFEFAWTEKLYDKPLKKIKIELISLNKDSYEYLAQIKDNLNKSNPFSTPNTNPSNNLESTNNKNEVLGFFCIFTSDFIEYK